MEITEAEWGVFLDLTRATLIKFPVPAVEMNELSTIVSSLRSEIVKPSGASKSLFDRIGGLGTVAVVCDKLAELMRVDHILNLNNAVYAAHQKINHSLYRNVMTQAIASLLGGPQKLSKTLQDSHRELKITDAQYSQFLNLLESALSYGKVQSRESLEIVHLIASLKPQLLS